MFVILGCGAYTNGLIGSSDIRNNSTNVHPAVSNPLCASGDFANDGFSTRRKVYKTAREEFFKDLIDNDSSKVNETSYDEFKRSIADNNLDPLKYIPKVRVSGKTIPTIVQQSGSSKTFAGSLASISESKKTNDVGQQNKSPTFRSIIEQVNISPKISPKSTDGLKSTVGYDGPMQTNSSYGSLKRRKEFKTANLPNLLR